ncbi:MAG: hypothetical protein MK198_12210 [Gracilimonas sp.]|jgi:hypothetical protein|uniref:hypothetical protein n=1 Tax=Gracilimonas sp. TaxID=1974203 RepID=UPI003750F4AA|nr:hypothetical protein [Gracilimonas sp.]
MDNVIYVWDPSTNDYLDWNGISGSLGSGEVKPFQAFWVKANGNGTPSLRVNKSSKTAGGTFYGKSYREPAAIGMKLTTDGFEKEMHIAYSLLIPGHTLSFILHSKMALNSLSIISPEGSV